MQLDRDVITPDDMRQLEASAMASGAVSGLELMERAGQGVVDAIAAHWPELARRAARAQAHSDRKGGPKAVILCGPGNNGGDGFVVARLLHMAGWRVEAVLQGDPARLPVDARRNWQRWSDLGRVTQVKDGDATAPIEQGSGVDLIVDAVFGIGLSRPVDPASFMGRCFAALTGANGDIPMLAIDVPSGLCGLTGQVLGGAAGIAPRADVTVTFHKCKPGHFRGQGVARCGLLHVVDIGL